MKRRIIIGNWKTNKTQDQVKRFLATVKKNIKNKKNLDLFGVAPVSIHLKLAKQKASRKMQIISQDANYVDHGAYTGTVSWKQLKDLNIKYSIIGHSERRMYYNDTDEIVNKKVQALLNNEMVPILCIGETLEEFESKKTNEVCHRQLKNAIAKIDEKKLTNLIIAYEPIWAIGTGKTATAEIAQNTIKNIRLSLTKLTNEKLAKKIPILYGGSVKPENCESLLSQPDIDGALIGGASLVAKDFIKILLGIK